jgi:hypothetical protein
VDISLLGDVVNANDVRVVECGRGSCFAQKPLDTDSRVRSLLGAEHLERDPPTQDSVFGEVHRPHAALSEQITDDVRAEAKAPVPPGEQLLGLELGQNAFAN